ncbi:HAMP domain-containing sensor histidine kinase [Bdellovibrio bacteriovorus]|uniref:histidine kinase n=1 Tax=Bdellovibrio bacteriovorus (strain ATCC 15356 / DSM 50701 / NCIMB 9529 / HD100) TaxID=264462 RepID=Q6MI13_BDEBA|nr:HAMP domain-containing sensor histidine kinase [Bdellovibrio bacteriovorus]CAE78169.1 Conserved sensor histidine kinase [Bdellovibrio bacteriovorus HD100]
MPGLIRFRWIAIVSLLLGTIPLLKWGYLDKRHFPYIIAVLTLLAILNVLAHSIWPKQEDYGQKQVLVHLWVDLLAASGLLFVSGSADNPFVSILCIHSFLGGMLLRKKASYVFGASVLLLLTLLQYETWLDSQKTVGIDFSELSLRFLSQWVLITASWFVSHYFSSLLARKEKRIRLLQDRQHQADRLKALGALTAGFSHQLATPMNSLKLRMERGLRKLPDESSGAREEFEKAQSSLDECVRVFQHMASVFSRSSQSELQRVELPVLVKDLIGVWEKENPGIVVESHLTIDSLWCRLQTLAFSQTLFDLLDNALEASPAQSPLYVRLFQEDTWAVLEVVDKGSGISAEILSRLGEPFVTGKEAGNGLGIYSAQMMAQASGGDFVITNNVSGKGVTSRIRLPLEEK